MDFSKIQKLGKALMLPIAVLPAAAILLRIGQPDIFDFPFISEAGNAIFSNLPLIFALGVAVGFSRGEAGAATLAGGVGYLVFVAALKALNKDLDMGVLGGIMMGLVAAYSYNKFYTVTLPEFIAFFSGKRLVPIVTALFALILAWLLSYVWIYIQDGLKAAGGWMTESTAGLFAYGFLNRLLLVTGLHHILNTFVWFQFGDFPGMVEGAPGVIHGDLTRFFQGDPTAGRFMSGFFPIMMGGLPGAALAMYFTARSTQRRVVAGTLFSVAFTAFLTGITEPIEYLFMFLAPLLYLVHALLTGLALVVTTSMGIHLGFGFSAGLFDYVLNWHLATNPSAAVLLIAVFFILYFVIFVLFIRIADLATPGRTAEEEFSKVDAIQGTERGEKFVEALGGRENIVEIDSCVTRLRATIKSRSLVQEKVLKDLGAADVLFLGDTNVQVIVGLKAEQILREMKIV